MRKVARISVRRMRNSIKTLSMTPRRNLAHGIIRGACVARSRQSLIIDHRIAVYESSFLRDHANLMTPRFLPDIQMALSRIILTVWSVYYIEFLVYISSSLPGIRRYRAINIIQYYGSRKTLKNFCHVLCKERKCQKWEKYQIKTRTYNKRFNLALDVSLYGIK